MVKILIIDDEADIVEYVSSFLTDFEIVAASNGIEALSALKINSDIGLIISDIKMPVMDGICMLRAMRILSAYDHIPIIIHSGVGERALVNMAASLGVRDWLVKPLEFHPFMETVKNKLNIA